ncbi:MAG: serine/threonine protein kinase, partial [Isosphaeraceae bacterium]
DIYFLGCVFYQMLTGQLPMKEVESKDMLAKMLKRSFGAIVPLSEHRLAPDPELAQIVERMMRIDLKSRYQTLDQVIADLEAYAKRIKGGITGMETSHEEEPDFLADLGDVFGPGGTADAATASTDGSAAPAEARAARKTLLCVESQPEIRDAFRKNLTKMGYKVVLMGDAERAAERYREEPTDAVIFDCDGLGPDAVDAFNDMHDRAHEDGLPLSALVILGPKQKDLREKLPTDDRLVVLLKPLKMKHVQIAVSRLAPIG